MGIKELDAEADEEYIASPLSEQDINDLKWLVTFGDRPDRQDGYRIITLVGLKKLVRYLEQHTGER